MANKTITGVVNRDSLCIHSQEPIIRQNFANSTNKDNAPTMKSAVLRMAMGSFVRSSNIMRLVQETKVMNPTITKLFNQIMETITKISLTKACQ